MDVSLVARAPTAVAPRSVEVRLRGGEPSFAVTAPTVESAAPPLTSAMASESAEPDDAVAEGRVRRRKTRSIDVTVELPTGSHVHGASGMGGLTATGRLGDVTYKTGLGHVQLDEAPRLTFATTAVRAARSPMTVPPVPPVLFDQ